MEERPNNLRSMLAEAKNLSELMVDLAYASVYFGSTDMAEEVGDLATRQPVQQPGRVHLPQIDRTGSQV